MTTLIERTAHQPRPRTAIFEVLPDALAPRRDGKGLRISKIGRSHGIGGSDLDVVELGRFIGRLAWVYADHLGRLPPTERMRVMSLVDLEGDTDD